MQAREFHYEPQKECHIVKKAKIQIFKSQIEIYISNMIRIKRWKSSRENISSNLTVYVFFEILQYFLINKNQCFTMNMKACLIRELTRSVFQTCHHFLCVTKSLCHQTCQRKRKLLSSTLYFQNLNIFKKINC